MTITKLNFFSEFNSNFLNNQCPLPTVYHVTGYSLGVLTEKINYKSLRILWKFTPEPWVIHTVKHRFDKLQLQNHESKIKFNSKRVDRCHMPIENFIIFQDKTYTLGFLEMTQISILNGLTQKCKIISINKLYSQTQSDSRHISNFR